MTEPLLPADSSPHDLPLLRWFFALPEPLPVPDGWGFIEPVGNHTDDARLPDDPAVRIVIHQVENEWGLSTLGAARALEEVLGRSEGLPGAMASSEEEKGLERLPTSYSVVEAITPAESPDPTPDDWSGRPADLSPRSDALMRCIRLISDVVRGYRLASATFVALPTYEQVPSPVILFHASGTIETTVIDGQPQEVLRVPDVWEGPSIVLLDHTNFPDTFPGPTLEGGLASKFDFWMWQLRSGTPLVLWRERYIEAGRSLYVQGDRGVAVVLANTASEVLLDSILALLLWEEGALPVEAAILFEEGKALARLKSQVAPRLKGNWSLNQGPVGEWYTNAHRLRHRVVHGGYTPTRAEAVHALDVVHNLERFLFDRLANQRTRYPRATLMTVAEQGLATAISGRERSRTLQNTMPQASQTGPNRSVASTAS